LFFKTQGDERVLPLVRRTLVKFPFMITGFGFAGGVFGYLWGMLVIGELFGKNIRVNAPSDFNHPNGSQTALVIFTLVGFCMSIGAELMVFSKIYKALRVPPENVSTNNKQDVNDSK
jgi:hypothetical protein